MLVTVPALGRRRTSLCVRTIVCLFLAMVLWLQLHLTRHSYPQPMPIATGPEENGLPLELPSVPLPSTTKVASSTHKTVSSAPREAILTNSRSSNTSQPRTIADIRWNIRWHNQLQTVFNEDMYGPVQNDTLIIVVQVHKRVAYLGHLIESLEKARDIGSVLLVFSHDFYDEEINKLVRSVKFCKVMQIFYPYSIQTHPNEFPGESPGDCPRNIKKDKARELQCNNALHPDSYGHYREARFTQIKHHWWWKANRVFNQLRVTRNHTGLVLYLEEDHYVVEDFIHVLRLMQDTSHAKCPRCNILSLGTYLKKYDYSKESDKAEVVQWTGNRHNMGMALNRTTWRAVLACAHIFCAYDDYNWDWSLQFSAQQCLQTDLVAMMMKQPRVFHLGECGLHHNKADCQPTAALSGVQRVLESASGHLYPSNLSITFPGTMRKKLVKSNGGWGDIRDHQLCLNISLASR